MGKNRLLLQIYFLSFLLSFCADNFCDQDVVSEQPQKNIIALLTLEGSINRAKPVIKQLLELSKDHNVKGLILHIDSRGGTSGSSTAIHSELKKFSQSKPIIVVIEDHCHSGAYIVASAADYIFAQIGSELGGIGIVTTIEKFKNPKLQDQKVSADLAVTLVRQGKYKDLGNPYLPLEDWHVQESEKKTSLLYNSLIHLIARARSISVDDEKIWADGKTFFAKEAIEVGLVDWIGDFSDAKAKMKELLQARGLVLDLELELVDVTQKL